MKICGACGEEFSNDDFSNKQWKLKQQQRRCKRCIDTNRELHLKASSKLDQELAETEPTPASGYFKDVKANVQCDGNSPSRNLTKGEATSSGLFM